MTPIERLTNNIRKFKTLLGPDVVVVSLNKSEPRRIPYAVQRNNKGYTTGVENDFVYIFKTNKDKEPSISFVCNYLDPKLPARFTAQVKMKDHNDSIISSPVLDFDGFRVGLNEMCKRLEPIQGDKRFDKLVIEEFMSVFMDDTIVDSESILALTNYKAYFEEHPVSLEISQLSEYEALTKKSLNEAKELSTKEIQNLAVNSEIRELRARLKVLEAQSNQESKTITAKYQVQEKTSLHSRVENKLKTTVENLETLKVKYLKKLPPMVRISVQTQLAREEIQK